MHKLFSAAIFGLFMTTGAAMAQSVSATYPGSVIDALSTLGHAPELSTDNSGDPLVNAQTDGLYYSVLFYGCEYNVNCKDIQFRATFTVDGSFDTSLLSAYNKDWFIGKTYMSLDADSNSIAVIEHAVVGVDGMSRGTFDRSVDKRQHALTTFRDIVYP